MERKTPANKEHYNKPILPADLISTNLSQEQSYLSDHKDIS